MSLYDKMVLLLFPLHHASARWEPLNFRSALGPLVILGEATEPQSLHLDFPDLKWGLRCDYNQHDHYAEEPQQMQIPFPFVKKFQGHHHTEDLKKIANYCDSEPQWQSRGFLKCTARCSKFRHGIQTAGNWPLSSLARLIGVTQYNAKRLAFKAQQSWGQIMTSPLNYWVIYKLPILSEA